MPKATNIYMPVSMARDISINWFEDHKPAVIAIIRDTSSEYVSVS